MENPHGLAFLPPVTSAGMYECNDHVHILELASAPTQPPGGSRFTPTPIQVSRCYINVLTLGHPPPSLANDASTAEPPQLPSVLTALSTADEWLALLPPWQSYDVAATRTLYIEQLHSKSGVSGTASGSNLSLSTTILRAGLVAPIRLQSLAAFEVSPLLPFAPHERHLGELSHRLISYAASIVDPALRRPLGCAVPAPQNPPFVRLENATPVALSPLYIGLGGTRLPPIQHLPEAKWATGVQMVARLIEGPGVIVNSVLAAALRQEHDGRGTAPGERDALRWVVGGGSSLPRGGNVAGQPDFILERRSGPGERESGAAHVAEEVALTLTRGALTTVRLSPAWKALVTCEAKPFVASSLLVKALRHFGPSGSVTLSQRNDSSRAVWDRLVTQVAQQVALVGAHCAVIWTGLDWLIFDRELSGTAAVSLALWPKLLRSVWMRDVGGAESGLRTHVGTRYDYDHLPKLSEEECDLNEAGILIVLALHARRRLVQLGIFEKVQLETVPKLVGPDRAPAPSDTDAPVTSSTHAPSDNNTDATLTSATNAPTAPNPNLEKLYCDEAQIGGGSYATTHRAWLDETWASPSSLPAPYVAKLPRDLPPPEDEDLAMMMPETGPGSFAAHTRRALTLEAEAYTQAAELQGSVLPIVKGTVPSSLDEASPDDSGELPQPSLGSSSSGSSLSESAEMDVASDASPSFTLPLGPDAAACSCEEQPTLPFHQTQLPHPAPAAVTTQQSSAARLPLIKALVMTHAGHSLRDLVLLGGSIGIPWALSKEAPQEMPSLRKLLSEAGLATKAAASAWLGAELVKAFEALHARGVSHGDVSAGNVCLDPPNSSPSGTLQVRLERRR